MPPRSSPGPSWEALKETATTDSSGDEREGFEEREEDEIDDTESVSALSVRHPQASLKRKDTEHLGTVSKRRRHDQETRQAQGSSGNASKISASAFSGWHMPRELTNPTASSSKSDQTSATNVSNRIPSGSRVASPSSSMLPPPSPVKAGTKDQNPKNALPSPERPKPVPKFKASYKNLAKPASQASEGSSFQRKEFPTSLSANLFNRPSASQPVPSTSKRSLSSNDASSRSQGHQPKSLSVGDSEVIDLCSDSDESPPPRPKQKQRASLPSQEVRNMPEDDDVPPAAKKNVVRKSIGGKAPQKSSPKLTKTHPNEVIDISSDSDDTPPSKPTSKTAAKPAVKPSKPSTSRPMLEKSASASKPEAMNVDRPLSAKPQSSASVTAPVPRKVSTKVSTDSMQIDGPPVTGSSTSIPAPVPRKPSITSSTVSMQVDNLPAAGPSVSIRPQVSRPAVSATLPMRPRPPSSSVQVDNESKKSVPSIPSRPIPQATQPKHSNSNLPQPAPRATAPTPNVGSSSTSSISNSKPVSTSSESTVATKFSRRQVAVKSTSSMKRRIVSSSPSSSSSSSGNGSDSDDEEEDEEEEEEEEEVKDKDKDKERARLTPAASPKGAGLEQRAQKEEQKAFASPSSGHPSPEPLSNRKRVDVDERPLGQALGLEGMPSAPKTPERTIRVKQQPVSPEIFSNKKGRVSQNLSVSASKYKDRGNTLESAIDLTSDNEDVTMAAPLPTEQSPSHVPTSASSKWKGKGRAPPEPSPTPAPPSETDDLVRKPSDSEPSLPPPSPSPPDKTPISGHPDFAKPTSGSFMENGRKSAPLVLSQETTTRPMDSAGPAGPLSADPIATSPSKGYVRSISLGSQAPGSFDATPVRDAGIRSEVRAIPPVAATSQGTGTPSHATTSISTRPSSPPIVAESGSAANEPSNPDSDVEMQRSETDDDAAMEEAAEVQALMEQSEDDMYDMPREPRAASASSEFEDSAEAGPSNRRFSRRSSRSSASGMDKIPSDDEDVHQESQFPSRNTTPEDGTVAVAPRGKTLGGFPAITWKEYRQNLANFTPRCRYGRDLPHTLQDHINNMSERTRKMPEIRRVFEAMIQENTLEDEPNAPRIELFNDIDDEPTPPWEFHYTNEMWHGENVPPPDIKNLTSCNCKGPCNPRSKTCACLKRQREAVGDPNLEFLYDKHGRLRDSAIGFPINECNDLCGCGDECRNRVVQHGRRYQIFIKKTEHKGWGVFAGSKKIPKGTFIGIYSGELLTDSEAHDRGVNYNKFGRTYLFDLDFHHLREGDKDKWSSKFTVDAYHAGNFTRFLNHSCDPNCFLQPLYINEGNLEKPLLVIFSERDIEANEEICFNYSGDAPDENDDEEKKEPGSSPSQTDKIYGRCMCGAHNCTGNMFKPPTK